LGKVLIPLALDCGGLVARFPPSQTGLQMAGEGDELVVVGVLVGCDGGLLDGADEFPFCEEAF